MRLYEKSVKLGYDLANCYDEGKDVKRDYTKAFYLFNEAANQGDAESQYKLALFYDKGKAVKKDTQKAFVYFQKAAEQVML